MLRSTKLLVIVGCHGDEVNGSPACPHLTQERTPRAGYAIDYFCTAVQPKQMVDGYIEWPSETRKPGDFPKFCPLRAGRPV